MTFDPDTAKREMYVREVVAVMDALAARLPEAYRIELYDEVRREARARLPRLWETT